MAPTAARVTLPLVLRRGLLPLETLALKSWRWDVVFGFSFSLLFG